MKAFVIDRYGKSQGRIAELPTPETGADDVLIKVHATSVNLLDSKIRNGEFKLILPYALPLIMGNDLAGVVVGVGQNVRDFKPGDEVYARPPQGRIGGFAGFIAIEQSAVALKPKNISMEQAAVLPLVALAAWQTLVKTAQLKKGEKVFIHAGSGGVSTVAIQLAKHWGPSWRRPPGAQCRVGQSVGRRKARKHGVRYAFVFMHASGEQLKEITALVESGIIKPVIDRTFSFDATAEALNYVEQGRAKGKVVIKLI